MENYGNDKKIVIGLCGLPARGKTYIGRKITRYLNWLGYKAKAFNIGNYRRLLYGTTNCTADFFNPSNEEAAKARDECAFMALKDLEVFLKEGGDIAVYDGTNSTAKRRKLVFEHLQSAISEANLMWIESVCDDEKIIEQNIKLTKISSPDYVSVDPSAATEDFKKRIEVCRGAYEHISTELDGPDTPYVKVINVGNQVILNNIQGYLQSKIVSFIMNLHTIPRPIYFSRHGESLFNIDNRVGGDPDLSDKGKLYAQELSGFFEREKQSGSLKDYKGVKIFTSTLRRAKQTANKINLGAKITCFKMLDELNVGICDGMTYKEIEKSLPQEALERNNDKLRYRYPRGESYLDLIHRIETVIFEIERSKDPVIVVAHQAILRCLYAYFAKHEILEVPFIDVPLNTVTKLLPETYFCHETRYVVDLATSTWKETVIHKPPLIDDYQSHEDFKSKMGDFVNYHN